MKKMQLDLDSLAVESFETAAPQGRGTVVGAAQYVPIAQTYPNCSAIDACPSAWHCSLEGTCNDPTCGQVFTCAKTCAATCQASCGFVSGCMGCSGPVCAV